jgi:5-methylcytosine-specific restriction enzyme A
MTRRQFIESHGATCKNWYWSWSFVNESKRLIIFGAWDVEANGRDTKIFSEDWRTNHLGRKNPGYDQSREHLRLIEEDGYRLMTFPMVYSEANEGPDGHGPAKIGEIIEELTEKKLKRVGMNWYATDSNASNLLAEEVTTPEKYSEGARFTVTINAYERSAKARAACIAHHGLVCAVCGFNFATVYGNLGEGFIHVHHIVPIGEIGKEYKIDPVKDLIPVCPNCHAMIHRTEPALLVEQLRNHLHETKQNNQR